MRDAGLLVAARKCWGLPFCVPAALGPLWGTPSWVGVMGVVCLVFSALFAAAGAYYRGSIDGIKWTQELYRR